MYEPNTGALPEEPRVTVMLVCRGEGCEGRGGEGEVCLHGLCWRLWHHCESRAAWRVICRCGVVALQVRPSARSIGCPGLRGARCRESAVSHEGRAGASQGCQRVQNTQLTCTGNFSTQFSPSLPEVWLTNERQGMQKSVYI